MAEEVLIAELRAGYDKFQADLAKATGAANTASTQMSQAFERSSAQTAAALNTIASSSSNVGAQIASAFQQASAQTTAALNQINTSVNALPNAFSSLNSSMGQVASSTQKTEQHTSALASAFGNLKSILAYVGIAAVAREFVQFGEAIYDASRQMMGAATQLKATLGSAKEAADGLKFIREETDRLAVSTTAGSLAFARLAAAAKGTALEGEPVRRLFTGISEAAVANNLSADQYKGTLTQLTQIMLKQKVTLEDLIIIGDNGIPIFQKLAESMGKSVPQLMADISKSKVPFEALLLLVEEFHNDFGKAAEDMAKQVPQSFERMRNRVQAEFTDLVQGILESKELIKAVQFESNAGDIFPSRDEITTKTNEILSALLPFMHMVDLSFLSLRDNFIKSLEEMKVVVPNAFKTIKDLIVGIWSDLESALTAPIDAIIKKFNALDEYVNGSKIGQWLAGLGEKLGIKEGVETSIGAFEKLDEVVTGSGLGEYLKNLGADMQLGKFLKDATVQTEELGEQIADVAKPWQNTTAQLEKRAEANNFDILNPKESGSAAEAAAEESRKKWEEKLNGLKDTIKKTSGDTNTATADEVDKTLDSLRKKVRREELADEEKHQEDIINLREETSRKVFDIVERYQTEEAKKIHEKVQEIIKRTQAELANAPVYGPPEPPDLDARNQAIKEQQEIFEDMRENIQDTLGNVLTDAFSGQINSIQDIASSIVEIFARTAGEISAAMLVKPLVNKMMTGLVGNWTGSGPMGGLIGKALSNINIPISGGMSATGRAGSISGQQLLGGGAAIIGGGFAGAGIGSAVTGGSMAGSIIGGAASGALVGATIGAPLLGVTALVGAAIGAVVGALAGLTTSLIAAKDKIDKSAIAIRTDALPPLNQDIEEGQIRRGPFGFISLVDEATSGPVDANTVLAMIAEADSAIAGLMSKRQRELASAALQGQPFELDAKAIDDAVAQTIQTRLFIVLRSLSDEQTAVNVVGEPYTGDAANIATLQKRAADAIAILKMMEDFQAGPMSDTGSAIKAINEQFEQLILRAEELGLATQPLFDEQNEQVAKVTSDFNADITQQLLRMTDPVAAQWAELEKVQAERNQNAIDAGADMIAVEALNVAEREDLARRLGLANNTINDDLARVGVEDDINRFVAAPHQSSTAQEMVALDESYVTLYNEAIRLGVATDGLTNAYRDQHAQIVQNAQTMATLMIANLINPFQAALIGVAEQVAELQQLANEGIIPQETVDTFNDLATQQAYFNEANRLASGAGDAQTQFFSSLEGFINSGLMSDVDQELLALQTQFENFYAALQFLGLPTDQLEASYAAQQENIKERERQRAAAEEERARQQAEADAERARQEAERRRQEQLQASQAIGGFIDTAFLSSVGQQLVALEQQLQALEEQALAAGVATTGLTAAYQAQRAAIIQAAQDQAYLAVANISNPFGAAILQISNQLRDFQMLANEGIIPQSLVDSFERLAMAEARYNEASRIASGAGNAQTQFFQSIEDFINRGTMSDVAIELLNLRTQFENFAAAMRFLGLPTDQLEASYNAQVNAIEQREAERRRQEAEQRRQAAEAEAERRRQEAERRRQEAQAEAERRRQEAEQRREQQKQAREAIAGFVDSAFLSDTGNQLSSLRKTYQGLVEQAREAGVGMGRLGSAYKTQYAEIIRDAREGFASVVMGLSNPFGAAMLQITQQVREFKAQVKDGILKAADVRRFEQAARAQARYAEASRIASGSTGDERTGFNDTIRTFISAASPIASLSQQFNELHDNAFNLERAIRFTGGSIKEVQKALIIQSRDLMRQAFQSVQNALFAITNPFGAALLNMQEQIREFQLLANRRLIAQKTVNQFIDAATRETYFNEASRLASGGGNAATQFQDTVDEFHRGSGYISDLGQQMHDLNEEGLHLQQAFVFLKRPVKEIVDALSTQNAAIFREAFLRVQDVIESFGSPFAGAMRDAQTQIDDLAKLVRDGLVSVFHFEQARRLILGDTQAQEALRRISRGPANSMEEVADAFQEFVSAGNPLTQAGQRLFDLTENFLNLADAANLLGYSTTELEASYNEQAQTIREDLIKEVDQQVQEQLEGVKAISDYLDSLKLAEEEPLNLRLDEAARQFTAALADSDIDEVISAASQYRDTAREQFGSAEGFFEIQSQIETALSGIRDREQAAADAERARLMAQADREQQSLLIGQTSLDRLQRISASSNDTARGVDELVSLARQSQARDQSIQALLERVILANRL